MLYSVVYTVLILWVVVSIFHLYFQNSILTSSSLKSKPVAEEEEVVAEEEEVVAEEEEVAEEEVAPTIESRLTDDDRIYELCKVEKATCDAGGQCDDFEKCYMKYVSQGKTQTIKCQQPALFTAKKQYTSLPTTIGLSLDINQLNNSVIQRELTNIIGNINKIKSSACIRYKKDFEKLLTNIENNIDEPTNCKDVELITNSLKNMSYTYISEAFDGWDDKRNVIEIKENIIKSTKNIINELYATFYNPKISKYDKKQFLKLLREGLSAICVPNEVTSGKVGVNVDLNKIRSNNNIQIELGNILYNLNKTQSNICTTYKDKIKATLSILTSEAASAAPCTDLNNIITASFNGALKPLFDDLKTNTNSKSREIYNSLISSTRKLDTEIKSVLCNSNTSKIDKIKLRKLLENAVNVICHV